MSLNRHKQCLCEHWITSFPYESLSAVHHALGIKTLMQFLSDCAQSSLERVRLFLSSESRKKIVPKISWQGKFSSCYCSVVLLSWCHEVILSCVLQKTTKFSVKIFTTKKFVNKRFVPLCIRHHEISNDSCRTTVMQNTARLFMLQVTHLCRTYILKFLLSCVCSKAS